MKALFIGSDPAIFDEHSAVRARLRAYASTLGELHVLSRGGKGITDEGSLKLYGIKAPKLFAPLALARHARRLIKERDIEVVSAQDPFEHGWAARKAVRGMDARLHVQVHTDFLSPWFVKESLLNRVRILLADRILLRADGIRAVSERVRRSIVARYGSRVSNPSVIPIEVSFEPPAPVPFPPHAFKSALITVGRLEKEKRIGDCIDAVASLVGKGESVGLFVVGEGRMRKALERKVHALKLEKNIIFLGARADARGLIASASAYVQASAYEGYGMTLMEAALAGAPIVTTDVGIVGEVLEPGTSVLLAPIADAQTLAAAVHRLLKDDFLQRNLADHARATAMRHLGKRSATATLLAEDLRRLVPVS